MKEEKKVYIFWDNSNIFISAKKYAGDSSEWQDKNNVRIDFASLFRLASAGRVIGGGSIVGSIPPEQRRLWDSFENTIKDEPINFKLLERGGVTGTEQGVDDSIQVHMLRYLSDEETPQIAVLMTGDGKGYFEGTGFHADLERMQKRGWGIEVLAWDLSCKKTLKDWAKNVGVFIPLEDYYYSITFIQGVRRCKSLNLTTRPRASVAINQLEALKERRRTKAVKRSKHNNKGRKKKKRRK